MPSIYFVVTYFLTDTKGPQCFPDQCQCPFYKHITPVLKDLHWLPIRKRIEFKILLLTFKCMQGCAPLYLRELLVKQANTRTLRSNTKNLLQIPLTNLKRFGDRAFCAYAPRLWNELPENIKKQLKTLLFRKEFN